ncbi:hypothetical protein [Brevundimonas sp. BAL3]|uniref:hypothetical protein n=1 Tax=Brevundimonas sp. BAL3 TaxID=391600 RepID=UPI00017EB718|nr:hypothetical protein [Brevundimonas sp. BAL3]EDX78953.1 hypothetical protein BBAL3_110 [Brevundimonas sp. BAL3]
MLKAWLTRPIGPLAPLGWLIAALAILMAVALISHGWNRLWSWLPWSTENQLDAAETQAATAQDQADASGLQAEGEGDQVRRIDTYSHQTITVQAVTADAVAQARSADDAETPLDDDRSGRLRDHDRELCRIAPDLDGCGPAAPDASGGG